MAERRCDRQLRHEHRAVQLPREVPRCRRRHGALPERRDAARGVLEERADAGAGRLHRRSAGARRSAACASARTASARSCRRARCRRAPTSSRRREQRRPVPADRRRARERLRRPRDPAAGQRDAFRAPAQRSGSAATQRRRRRSHDRDRARRDAPAQNRGDRTGAVGDEVRRAAAAAPHRLPGGRGGPARPRRFAGMGARTSSSRSRIRAGRFLRRLASFARTDLLRQRGTGLSDRVPTTACRRSRTAWTTCVPVIDDVGSERAAIFGVSEGGNLAALFPATYPERTVALADVSAPSRNGSGARTIPGRRPRAARNRSAS